MSKNILYEGIEYSNQDDLPCPPKTWGGDTLKKWFCGMAALKVVIEAGGKVLKSQLNDPEGLLYKELEPLLVSKYKADINNRKGKSWSKWFDQADWALTYRKKEGRFIKDNAKWRITEKGRQYYEQYQKVYEERYLFLLGDFSFLGGDVILGERQQRIKINQQIEQFEKLSDVSRDRQEKRVVQNLQKKLGGESEVMIVSVTGDLVGFADIVTDREIIEVKKIENWKHAVGQVYSYWLALQNSCKDYSFSPRIHLFGVNDKNQFMIQQTQNVLQSLGLDPVNCVTFE